MVDAILVSITFPTKYLKDTNVYNLCLEDYVANNKTFYGHQKIWSDSQYKYIPGVP